MKSFLLGVIAGFIAVGAVLLAMGRLRQAAPAGEPEASTAVEPATDPRIALRAELATLTRENSELLVNSVREPQASPGVAGSPSRSERFRESVRSLVTLFTSTRRALNDQWFTGSLEADALRAEFSAQVVRLCAETGLRPDELLLCPDFRWALLGAAYETREERYTGEARERFEAAAAQARKDWDAYESARNGLPPLEQMRALQGMEAFLEKTMQDSHGDPFRLEWIAPYAHPCEVRYPPTFRTEQEAVTAMRDAWAQDFGLGATEAAALEPAVRDYMRLTAEYFTSRRAQVTRREDLPDWRLGELDAMIETRRWIEANVSLTQEQRRRVSEWSKLYEYRVNPEAEQGK